MTNAKERRAAADRRNAQEDMAARTAPQNLDAEKAILGAILVHNDAYEAARGHVTPPDFFRQAHRILFMAMGTLIEERKVAVDFTTLKEELARCGALEECGGPVYIGALADGVPRATNVGHYARIVREKALLRGIIDTANKTLTAAYAAEESADRLILDAERSLIDLQRGRGSDRVTAMRGSSGAMFTTLEWRVEHKGELRGVDTGYPSINALTLGWRKGDLIIIGARPSIGKTTFALNSAVLGAQTGKRAAVFSLEMRTEQLQDRILAQLSGVQLSRIQNGHLGAMDFKALAPALETISGLPVEIDDRSGLTAVDIRRTCRRLQAEGGLDLVLVDYVQLMGHTLDRRGSTRTEEIGDNTVRLKNLADELSCPIILVSQLSRTKGARPVLEDLRESGALEQAADVVLLLHRKDHRTSGTTEAILAKQRNGETGTVNLTIDRDTTTFSDGGETVPDPEKTPEEKKQARQRTMARKYGGR